MTAPSNHLQAAGFWVMAPAQRKPALLEAIARAHTWHYERNPAYRRLVRSRGVGRGGFPQLAYSWDGLLPLVLLARRQRGHFTTIEFYEPWTQIYETHQLIGQALSAGTRDS